MNHEHLAFSEIRETHPDRWDKADLAETSISSLESPGEWVVQRSPDDDSHVVELVRAFSQAWGHCSCDGFQFHDGPCSHLCAVWRAFQRDLVDVPRAQVRTIEPVVGQQTLEPTDDDVKQAVTDGGEIDYPGGGHDGREFGRPEGRL